MARRRVEQQAAVRLAKERGLSLTGRGAAKRLTKTVLETSLSEKMTGTSAMRRTVRPVLAEATSATGTTCSGRATV